MKTAYLQRKEAEQAVTAAHDREGKARKEAQRKLDEALKLENENPFQQQLNIRKMRAHALELTAQADAAAAQGAAAQETALHWVRVLEDEEVKHTALVSDSAPLLRDKDEALQLLAWHDLPVAAVPPPPLLPVLATPHDDVATKPAQTQHAVLPQEQSPGEARHRADSVGAVAHGALTAAARGEGGERERDRVTLPHIAEVARCHILLMCHILTLPPIARCHLLLVATYCSLPHIARCHILTLPHIAEVAPVVVEGQVGGAAEVLSVSRTTSWGTVSGDEASSLPSEPSRGSWHVSDTDVGVATVTAGSGGAMVVEETEGEGLNVNRGSRPRSQVASCCCAHAHTYTNMPSHTHAHACAHARAHTVECEGTHWWCRVYICVAPLHLRLHLRCATGVSALQAAALFCPQMRTRECNPPPSPPQPAPVSSISLPGTAP